jgi:hypothetical protein
LRYLHEFSSKRAQGEIGTNPSLKRHKRFAAATLIVSKKVRGFHSKWIDLAVGIGDEARHPWLCFSGSLRRFTSVDGAGLRSRRSLREARPAISTSGLQSAQ